MKKCSINRKFLEGIIQEISVEIKDKFNSSKFKQDLGLLSGKSGSSLFMFYASRYFDNSGYEKLAQELLESTFDDINQGASLPTFCGGLAGIGWSINHLVENNYIEQNNLEVLNDFDGYLMRSLFTFLKQKNFDFLHGATGIVYYFLDRVKGNMEVQKCLQRYIEELHGYAIIDENNKTAKIISNVKDVDDNPKQVYNLSLSHGISSVIIILCKMHDVLLNHNDKDECKKLIEYFSNFIIVNEMIPDKVTLSKYPSWVGLNDNDKNSYGRLSWCYGDIGNGFAFFNAYKILQDKQYLKKANEIFDLLPLRKSTVAQGISDAGICHGTSGLAIISNRLDKIYFMDNDNYELASYWINSTLDYYFAKGLRGFDMYIYNEGYRDEISILNGISGIGLAILSYIDKKYMNWDKMLLIS